MQYYHIILDAQRRQQNLIQEAAANRLVRGLDHTAKPSLLRRGLRTIGGLLASLSTSLQRLQMSSPAAASAHLRRAKRSSS